MAAAFGGGATAAPGARAGALRAQAIELAERELHAYEPVLRALRLPASDPQRGVRLDSALSDAAEPPLAVARAAAELAELAGQIAAAGSPHLRGDAEAALQLAGGACRAALRLVEINLAGRPRDPRHDEAHELARRTQAQSGR